MPLNIHDGLIDFLKPQAVRKIILHRYRRDTYFVTDGTQRFWKRYRWDIGNLHYKMSRL